MWSCGRMGKNQLDRLGEKEVVHTAKEKRNSVLTVRRKGANWIEHILRRNCLLKHSIEGKIKERIEMIGRQGIRLK
jgi:hypothetical protein